MTTPQAPTRNPAVTGCSPTITDSGADSPTQSLSPPPYAHLPFRGSVRHAPSTTSSTASLLPAYTPEIIPPAYSLASAEAGQVPPMMIRVAIPFPTSAIYGGTAVNGQDERGLSGTARDARALRILLVVLLTAAASGAIALAFIIPRLHHDCRDHCA